MARGLTLTSSSDTYVNNRRRRSRLNGRTQGWILPLTRRLAKHSPSDDEAWEVRIQNLSRFGIGFTSTERFRIGEEHRLRIGRGPMKRARTIRIVACRETQKGTFSVGAEFIDNATREFARAG
jgi:hypothetical protein